MATSASGANAGVNPARVPTNTRNASENRDSMNTLATVHTTQKLSGIARTFRLTPRPFTWGADSGSRTPIHKTATDMNAGITAIHKTVRSSPANARANSIANTGPAKAPTVSSD